jgi:acetyl-CoA synthetase
MNTAAARIAELVARFGAADACPARLLCDDHPTNRVAFTVVEADLTRRDLTYGELRRRSEQVAAGLLTLGVRSGDAVVGAPDELRGEVVEAYVVPRASFCRTN